MEAKKTSIIDKIKRLKKLLGSGLARFQKASPEEQWITISSLLVCVFAFFPFAELDQRGYGEALITGWHRVTFLPMLLVFLLSLQLCLRFVLPIPFLQKISPGSLGYHAFFASILGLLLIIIIGFNLNGIFNTFSVGNLRFGYSLCFLSQAFSLFLSFGMMTQSEKSALVSFFSPKI